MKHLIISFKSREHVFYFSRNLQQNGVFNSIINTPSKIGATCSLSIKCDAQSLSKVKSLISQKRHLSFSGLYSISVTHYG